MLVVVAAMFLTVPIEAGFGRESLGEKFLLLVPGKDETAMGMGRSLAPLTNLIKTMIGWEEERNGTTNEEMID
jgi:hypothetical protein